MPRTILILLAAFAALGLGLYIATDLFKPAEQEDIFAYVNYRSLSGGEDGVAIANVTPGSDHFGQITQTVKMGRGTLPHHPYYNRDRSKLYNTALNGQNLYRVDLEGTRIHNVVPLDARNCRVGEDLYFSRDGSKFYLTCMGSDRVLVFDGETDTLIDEIRAPYPDEFNDTNSEQVTLNDPQTGEPLGEITAPTNPFIHWPHGIAANELIDRMIVTETIKPDLSEAGTHLTIIRPSTGDILQTIPLMKEPGELTSPVEVTFHPNSSVAYVTGMMNATLWALTWDPQNGTFTPHLVDDGSERGHSWPLEMVFGPGGYLYVSWADPGVVNVYDVSDAAEPELVDTLPAEAGAHHIDFSPNGRYMYVQNNLLNLEGLSSGTLTVVDLATGRIVETLTSFLDAGLMPESFLILGSTAHQH